MAFFKTKEEKKRLEFLKKKISVGERLTYKEKCDWKNLTNESFENFEKRVTGKKSLIIKHPNTYSDNSFEEQDINALINQLEKEETEKTEKKNKDIVSIPKKNEESHVSKDKKAGVFHTGVHCPYCKSLNVQFMQNNRKGFSVGKAAAGAALTGGVGTLAGFAGKKGKKNQWRCNNCGHTFTSKK